jgi:hypothetical protein
LLVGGREVPTELLERKQDSYVGTDGVIRNCLEAGGSAMQSPDEQSPPEVSSLA